MKCIGLVVCFMFIISCNFNKKKAQDSSLKEWILSNQHALMISADNVIQNYYKTDKIDSNWVSSTIAITKNGPASLSALANKIQDSTDCIVVELTFFKDVNKKRSIMLAVQDSGCLNSLNNAILATDSTTDFIFGKDDKIEK